MKQSRSLRFASETRWWIQVVQQRTDTGEQMPQMQFQSVKQTQDPSPESSEEDRDSTVTACTRKDAIRNPAHEAGKDLRRARYSQSGCCQDCQRSSQRSRRQWRCRCKQTTANVRRACRLKETSRAKSNWHDVCLSDEDICVDCFCGVVAVLAAWTPCMPQGCCSSLRIVVV